MKAERRKKNPGDGWVAVNKQNPCPICKKPDNCKISSDGLMVWCGRTESDRQNDGGQYLHKVKGKSNSSSRPRPKKTPATNIDMEALAERYVSNDKSYSNVNRWKLASELDVSKKALRLLQVGWDGSSWTFPERDATGKVIGIVRRSKKGNKICVKGSKRGLTFATNWNKADGPIFLVEGASDTAAGMTLGLSTIGRPSARGGNEFLADLLRDVSEDRQIIVLGERDEKEDGNWPGRDGAIATAQKLATSLGRSVGGLGITSRRCERSTSMAK
jgi:phage/plasmid primase-like uncharacterized protein